MKRLDIWIILFLAIVSLLVAYGDGESPDSTSQQSADEGIIVAAGDSLTAGLGVAEEKAYPALLEKKLRSKGYHYDVINAGVSGETSSGLLSRIKWILTLKPDLIILATGANDGLRGIDPHVTQRNIHDTIVILKEHNVGVVLAGMKMVQNLGEEYTEAFADIYPTVAEKHSVVLIPFLLKDVAGEPELNQRDGIHPNAKGYEIVAETVYPYVIEAIKRMED